MFKKLMKIFRLGETLSLRDTNELGYYIIEKENKKIDKTTFILYDKNGKQVSKEYDSISFLINYKDLVVCTSYKSSDIKEICIYDTAQNKILFTDNYICKDNYQINSYPNIKLIQLTFFDYVDDIFTFIIANSKGEIIFSIPNVEDFDAYLDYDNKLNIFIFHGKKEFRIYDTDGSCTNLSNVYIYKKVLGNRILVEDYNGNKGLINRLGVLTAPCLYDGEIEYIGKFSDKNYYIASDSGDDHLISEDGYIDITAKSIKYLQHGIFQVKKILPVFNNSKSNYIYNINNKEKVYYHDEALIRSNIIIIGLGNDKYKLMNLSLTNRIGTEYDSIEVVQNYGILARVKKEDKNYCLDLKTGKEYEFVNTIENIGDNGDKLYYIFLDDIESFVLSNDFYIGNIIDFKEEIKDTYSESSKTYIDYKREIEELERMIQV